MQFTKEMSIQDALFAHPQVREVFEKLGLPCMDCMASTMESIEAGASMHGLNVEELLKELNGLSGGHGEER